jgi:signal transduction histidine kinase
MNDPIQLLLIEDNEDDAILLINQLRNSGLNIIKQRTIQTEKTLKQSLIDDDWDIVISDYTMPGFDGLQALAIVREYNVDLPFILISGAIGEEIAVAALKAGANDYLLKDRLSRLPSAIKNELNTAKQQKRLKETQAQLVIANETAVLANKRKSQVLAFMAHEFKNPLQAITLFSDLLHDEIYGTLNQKQHTSVSNIQIATQHLKTLVNDILDIAAIEAGKIKLNICQVDIISTIDQVLTLTRELGRQKNIAIENIYTINELIMNIDELRIKQVVINLISNAIKYSPENTCITLTLSKTNTSCSISIQDQGIGISEGDLTQLFQEFYRVDHQKSTHIEGVGLGLALTKTLVDLHHGRIDVMSEPGKGTTFTVVLPV